MFTLRDLDRLEARLPCVDPEDVRQLIAQLRTFMRRRPPQAVEPPGNWPPPGGCK